MNRIYTTCNGHTVDLLNIERIYECTNSPVAYKIRLKGGELLEVYHRDYTLEKLCLTEIKRQWDEALKSKAVNLGGTGGEDIPPGSWRDQKQKEFIKKMNDDFEKIWVMEGEALANYLKDLPAGQTTFRGFFRPARESGKEYEQQRIKDTIDQINVVFGEANKVIDEFLRAKKEFEKTKRINYSFDFNSIGLANKLKNFNQEKPKSLEQLREDLKQAIKERDAFENHSQHRYYPLSLNSLNKKISDITDEIKKMEPRKRLLRIRCNENAGPSYRYKWIVMREDFTEELAESVEIKVPTFTTFEKLPDGIEKAHISMYYINLQWIDRKLIVS